MAQKMLVIMNPFSGLKQGKKYLADILQIFCKADYQCTVYMTSGRLDATNIAKKDGGKYDKVICIGGDGTFNETVSGLLMGGHETPIGYIPAGSTNDFANSLKLPKNMLKCAELMVEGTPQHLDIGQFNERYFSYVASFGAFTKASYSTPQNVKNALGHLAYILEGIKEIGNIKPRHVKFTADGEAFEDDYIFGAISNSTSVGGILTLSPDVVDMNDGLFEILLVKSPMNLLDLNECIGALTTQNYKSRMLVFKSASDILVQPDKETEWTLDGEYEKGTPTVQIHNIHDAIHFIM